MSYPSDRQVIRRETERQIRRLKLVPPEYVGRAATRYLNEGARAFRIVDGELHDDLDLDAEKVEQLVTSLRIRAKVADEDVQQCARLVMRAARIGGDDFLAGILRLVREVDDPVAALSHVLDAPRDRIRDPRA